MTELNTGKRPFRRAGAVMAVLAVVAVFLTVLEVIRPYYFLKDDNLHSYQVVYEYTAKSLFENGEFALYDFHQFGGTEFFAHGQTGLFNPLVYISYLLSNLVSGNAFAMIDIIAFCLILISCAGMFILLRKLGLRDLVCFAGSVSWALNSFIMYMGRSWMIVLITAAFLPFIVLADIKMFGKGMPGRRDFKNIFISALAKGMFLLIGGHPQFYFYALLFDIVFVFFYAVSTHTKEKELSRKRLLAGGTLSFILSCVMSLVIALPLLLPMVREIMSSSYRNFDINSIIEGKEDISMLPIALFFPFDRKISGCYFDIQYFAGHIGIILALSSFYQVSFLFDAVGGRKLTGKQKKILSLLPVLLLALIYACSEIFLRITFYIPVINGFRYSFKIILFFTFFFVVFCCLNLDLILERAGKKIRSTRVITLAAALISVITILDYGILYYAFLPKHWGLENSVSVPYEEPLCEVLEGGRYITVAYPALVTDADGYQVPFNYTRSSAFYYATKWGLDYYLGYDSIVSDSLSKRDDIPYNDYGIIYELDEDDISDLRRNGVNLYVVYKGAGEYYEGFRTLLEEQGMTVAAEEKDRVVYADPLAAPIVSAGNGSLKPEINVNSIEITTADDYEGGKVTFNYNTDPYLLTKIDGKKTEHMDDDDGMGISVEVPSGKHVVTVEYKDMAILAGTLVSLFFTAGCVILTLHYKNASISSGKASRKA